MVVILKGHYGCHGEKVLMVVILKGPDGCHSKRGPHG